MPRDANGNYTLPVGNPVITGTPITTVWANPTMQDLGNEITDSLSRTGEGGMLVPFENISGAVATPGITWVSETTSGFYRAGTNDMRAAVNGIDRQRWTETLVQLWNSVDVAWEDVATTKNLVDSYLPLAGGTVTGNIVGIDPVVVGDLTRKDYVDIADALKLNLTGGTVTGQIKGIAPIAIEDLTRKDYVDGLNVQNVKLTGDQTIAGVKTFSSNPLSTAVQSAAINALTRKDYVDDLVAAIGNTNGTTATGGWSLSAGVYTEWGVVNTTTGNPVTAVVFDRPFANTNYNAQATVDMSNTQVEQGAGYGNKTVSGMNVKGSWDGGTFNTAWKVQGFI
jgi:hypothetical protein